jgi:imidazolonepropionase-like amidohydrolase
LSFALTLIATLTPLLAAPRLAAQGGEPQYFAIRGATVVPVSGPRIENATVIVSRGVITAVGKDASIPEEAWVVDGKA